MKKIYQLDKTFGPTGAAAGIFLFIFGLITTYYSMLGLILVPVGAFLAFTSTSSIIDFDLKRIKFSNDLFGIIHIGKWINIDEEMKLGIKKSNIVWRSYSRSNQSLDIEDNDYRLVLFDQEEQEIMPISKFKNLEKAVSNRNDLGKQLGIGIID